jgi:hypothetical protein
MQTRARTPNAKLRPRELFAKENANNDAGVPGQVCLGPRPSCARPFVAPRKHLLDITVLRTMDTKCLMQASAIGYVFGPSESARRQGKLIDPQIGNGYRRELRREKGTIKLRSCHLHGMNRITRMRC